MGNLCSIFHTRFKNLIKIIPCARKAQLMDYILLGWQKSTYTLKNSDKKWFMKPHDEIVEETQIKLSTLREYLKEFEKEGFIERRQARYNRKNSNGEYYVTMGGYIHITDKFIDLIKADPINSPKTSQDRQVKNVKSQMQRDDKKPNSTDFDNKQIIDSLKTGESYIRDLRNTFNNNIKFKKLFLSVENSTLEKLISQYESIQNYVDTEIKEEIPDEIRKTLLGTFFNLTFEHKKQLSSPQQVAAEYLFSLINTTYCLPQVNDFKHRNNILAKKLRSNQWKTPKGFYTHFYLGQNFKDKQQMRDKKWQEQKEREMNPSNDLNLTKKNKKLMHIEAQIVEKGALIETLTESIYQQTDEDHTLFIRQQIVTLKQELSVLYDEQWIIEKELENEANTMKCCA